MWVSGFSTLLDNLLVILYMSYCTSVCTMCSLYSLYCTCHIVLLYVLCVASGEPPQCMSCSVLFATKRAVESAREDSGNTQLFPLGRLST